MTGKRFAEMVDDLTALAEIAVDLGLTVAQVRMVARKLGELPAAQWVRLSGVATVDSRQSPGLGRVRV